MKILTHVIFLALFVLLTPYTSAKTNKSNTVTVLVTGDIMLGRKVNQILTKKNDFSLPYKKLGQLLSSSDITVINLESPLVNNCPITEVGMVFCGNNQSAKAMSEAGIDIASLANNHSFNYGQEGINNTIKVLEKSNILPFGAGQTAKIQKKGMKFVFLGYNDIQVGYQSVDKADVLKIKSDIIKNKKESDYVIVMFHWGSEYVSKPSVRQIELAHASIDSGADLVVGNHPHWVQETEIYKNTLIVYSHGNFIFDQMWSVPTRQGIIGIYTFKKNKKIKYNFIPIVIDDFYLPRLASPKEKMEIFDRMNYPI